MEGVRGESEKIGMTLDIENDEAGVMPGERIGINYTLSNATDATVVTASSDGNYTVRVEKASTSQGKIIVTAPKIYTDGYVNVMVSDGAGYSFIRVINFYESEISFPNGYQYSIATEGGELNIPLSTNVSSSDSWITVEDIETKAAMQSRNLKITVAQNNNNYARTGKIRLTYANSDGINDPEDMIFEGKANFANYFTIQLPLQDNDRDYPLDCYVDWGDGVVEHITTNNPSHAYEGLEMGKTFTIKVSGKVPKLGGCTNIQAVKQWGNTGLRSMNYAFEDCTTLQSIPDDTSGAFAEITSFYRSFSRCTGLTTIPGGLFSNCANMTTFGRSPSFPTLWL